MRKVLALLLATLYLGSYALHGLAHDGRVEAKTCAACAVGQARVQAPQAPAVADVPASCGALEVPAAVREFFGLLHASASRAPPSA